MKRTGLVHESLKAAWARKGLYGCVLFLAAWCHSGAVIFLRMTVEMAKLTLMGDLLCGMYYRQPLDRRKSWFRCSGTGGSGVIWGLFCGVLWEGLAETTAERSSCGTIVPWICICGDTESSGTFFSTKKSSRYVKAGSSRPIWVSSY